MTAVRDTCTVTVSEPVDGTVRRRRSAKPHCEGSMTYVRVDPRVMAAAKRVRREGERIVLVSSVEVMLIPDPAR